MSFSDQYARWSRLPSQAVGDRQKMYSCLIAAATPETSTWYQNSRSCMHTQRFQAGLTRRCCDTLIPNSLSQDAGWGARYIWPVIASHWQGIKLIAGGMTSQRRKLQFKKRGARQVRFVNTAIQSNVQRSHDVLLEWNIRTVRQPLPNVMQGPQSQLWCVRHQRRCTRFS